MITLSLNFDNLLGGAARNPHEKTIREINDTHLAFPGSDKLKFDVNIKDNGSSSVSFTGPKDAIAEAKRLWKENVQPTADKVKKAIARANKQAKDAAKIVKANATKAVKKTTRKTAVKKAPAKAKVVKAKSPLTRTKAVAKAKVKVAKKAVKKKR